VHNFINTESAAKNTLFISHATPDDNEFARWLSLQLIGLGYSVWCDEVFCEVLRL